MIDINLIRNEPEKVKAALLKKGWEVDFTSLLALDKKDVNYDKKLKKAKLNKMNLAQV